MLSDSSQKLLVGGGQSEAGADLGAGWWGDHERWGNRTHVRIVPNLSIDDPDIEEIWINEPGKVFVATSGRPQLTTTVLSEQQVHDLVEVMLRASGRRVDLSCPFVDATLADGSRLHVVIPDITRRHWAVNIRRFVLRAHSWPSSSGLAP